MSAAKHTSGPQAGRLDIDFYPAWMDENPALFVQRVREFLDNHPAEQWDCRIGKFVYLVRLTAIAKATGADAALHAEKAEQLERDAMRYRQLRQMADSPEDLHIFAPGAAALDDAVDAAINATQPRSA